MELTEMLTRGPAVDDELVFFAMPYGKRTLPNGEDADFDVLYERYFAEAVRSMGLTPERADCMPGTMESPLSAAWNGVDRAGVVVIDLSLPSTSVSMELGWAMALHKRAIVIHHEGALGLAFFRPEDKPSIGILELNPVEVSIDSIEVAEA